MFRIIEISDDEMNNTEPTNIFKTFKYAVQHVETEAIWYGSNMIQECQKYIVDYGN